MLSRKILRSETEFIQWLRGFGRWPIRGLALGIGDDAALVRMGPGRDLILTTDLSIEGVHFRRDLHPPRSVGHRALARGLSDVAAMGGTPRFVLVSLALSKKISPRWVKSFYSGVHALARRMGVTIIGGDTAMTAGISFVDVVVVGEVPAGQAMRRSGARPGDQIFISGRLGVSALGLRLLKSGKVTPSSASKKLRAHLYPEPRINLGKYLRENGLASAAMDLSDGLSSDLARLCAASGVGAVLWEHKIPRPKNSLKADLSFGTALDLALNGGEDYELLFTVRPRKASRVPAGFKGIPIHPIGEICRSRNLSIVLPDGNSKSLKAGGYDHFRG
jgi:thiamine-monophosphate kinase